MKPHKSLFHYFPLPAFRNISNLFVWLWVFSVLVSVRTAEVNATTKNTGASQTQKGRAPSGPNRKPAESPPQKSFRPRQETTPIEVLEKREHVVQQTKAGDSLLALLNRFSLSPTEKRLWTRSIQRNLGSTPLPIGREVHFFFSPATNQGSRKNAVQLKALEVDYNEAWSLTWEHGIWGIAFRKQEKPYDVELATAGTVIERSLFEDGQRAGIQSSLLSQLVDIFTWEIDLEKDIQPGDSVKILYEQRSRKGQDTKAKLRVLAAELISAGQKLTAIYFEKQKGLGGYYNLEGRSLARAFLRFPLEFTSITSHFTDSRFHPILKTDLPHIGVDFAAKRGTPVRAVGDGVITQARWNGGYGKTIDIQHDSTYRTRYAHLGQFARGIRSGVSVKKGQIIGYVGSTGRSTGPHLHFEFYKDGQYLNPLSADFPAEDQIEPALQKLFDNQKNLFLVQLTAPPRS
jgi:murein DD-endopeptidase MepM/ murein hydrolase activator NlpD